MHFPDNIKPLQIEFYNIIHFPQVVGCIDCTHVRIKCPSQEQAMLYLNRKGFYSLNVQVICDAQRRILDIVVRWRGSVHDSRIWDLSRLKEDFEVKLLLLLLLLTRRNSFVIYITGRQNYRNTIRRWRLSLQAVSFNSILASSNTWSRKIQLGPYSHSSLCWKVFWRMERDV